MKGQTKIAFHFVEDFSVGKIVRFVNNSTFC